ncbi:cytochrome c oxidase subunit 6b-1-like [Vicia villosa]|uniref:cytochrome c oxidase subunit 6b-1-like n=1 Tax=Vicia villosa TaxID=3911 RepID=UPI00273B85F2|nr:cytochrome c oxidase subunit 6b-1-like [Vicia villosa]
MAETADKSQTLAEQYYVKDKQDKVEVVEKPVAVEEVEKPKEATSAEAVVEKAEESTLEPSSETVVQESNLEPSSETVVQESNVEPSSETVVQESNIEPSSETVVDQSSGDQEEAEEKPEIKLETAPVDFRFPTTNQTRHCFTRYIEYHRCVAAKGDDAQECDKFAKYYRALCPGEWVDRWNEQRENGTFPGPL